MANCSACGMQNPDGFRFCGFCGSRLPTPSVKRYETRKTVTVVFVDLVGLTELGERLDLDYLFVRGGALLDLADVLRSTGHQRDALAAVDHAVRLYDRKGNVASAAKAWSLLAPTVPRTWS